MNNRVIGVIGVGCINSNWNADFSGNPKMYLDEYVASPFALKYAIRSYWQSKGFKVYFRKSYKELKGKVIPNSLEERYLSLYEKDKFPKEEVDFQNDIFSAIDVMNFGGVFPVKEYSSSYTGAVQITTAINKYTGAETVRDVINSQFRNSNKAESGNATLGNRSILSEGHFFYGFTINPFCYDYIKQINSDFKGYTKEAYEAFKEASLYAVNNVNSVSKGGCYNEFALFVTLKENSLKIISNIHDTIKFNKANEIDDSDGLNQIDVSTALKEIEAINDDVEAIEIYYNPILTKVLYNPSSLDNKIKKFNILNPTLEV